MFRNKSRYAGLFLLGAALLASACADGGKLVTDTGSGTQKEISREEYLDEDALNLPPEQREAERYRVHILEKGSFTEQGGNLVFSRYITSTSIVWLDIEGECAQYVGGMANQMQYLGQYVEPGDPVARIVVDYDELLLEETKLKLTRLQERYARGEAKLSEDLEDMQIERTMIYNDYERMVVDVRCRQMQLDWEMESRAYERQIAKTQEMLQALNVNSAVQDIEADKAGYIVYAGWREEGSELKDGDYICHIISPGFYCLDTGDQTGGLEYGQKLEFKSEPGLTGTVVSGGSRALYGNLDQGQVIVRADFADGDSPEVKVNIVDLIADGSKNKVENVVLVPKEAVTVEEDQYFVTVLKEDGSLLKTEFIPGGSNKEVYWVWDGLTEGEKIIYY